jgi:hypothetical protein
MRGKALAEDLLEVVRGEHAKVMQIVQAQQMELHQAQVQYAAYSAMAVCITPLMYSFPPRSATAQRRSPLVCVTPFHCLLTHSSRLGTLLLRHLVPLPLPHQEGKHHHLLRQMVTRHRLLLEVLLPACLAATKVQALWMPIFSTSKLLSTTCR